MNMMFVTACALFFLELFMIVWGIRQALIQKTEGTTPARIPHAGHDNREKRRRIRQQLRRALEQRQTAQ